MPLTDEIADMSTLPSSPDTATAARAAYWRKVRALTLKLLALWFAVNIGVIFFARELASLTLGGWPVPFYMAAQGTTLIYLLIIGVYAHAVNQLEREIKADTGKGGDDESA